MNLSFELKVGFALKVKELTKSIKKGFSNIIDFLMAQLDRLGLIIHP